MHRLWAQSKTTEMKKRKNRKILLQTWIKELERENKKYSDRDTKQGHQKIKLTSRYFSFKYTWTSS